MKMLANIFGRAHSLSRLARQQDPGTFVRRLGGSDIYVIADMQGDGLDPSRLTPEQLIAEVERAAKELNDRQNGFEPFVYEVNGCRHLPFFTSNAHAETFCGAYSKERDRVYPFQLLGVRGATLWLLLHACDVLVMNEKSDDEYLLTQADTEQMRIQRSADRATEEHREVESRI